MPCNQKNTCANVGSCGGVCLNRYKPICNTTTEATESAAPSGQAEFDFLGALDAQVEEWSLAADYADSQGKNTKQRNRRDGLSYGLRKCVKELNAIINTGT